MTDLKDALKKEGPYAVIAALIFSIVFQIPPAAFYAGMFIAMAIILLRPMIVFRFLAILALVLVVIWNFAYTPVALESQGNASLFADGFARGYMTLGFTIIFKKIWRKVGDLQRAGKPA